MSEQPSVSLLGLGVMGAALARAFLKNGIQTTVWNRSPGKAEMLVGEGAGAASSAAECVTASKIVIACVIDPEAFSDIFTHMDSTCCNGKILVDYTSGSPSQIRHSYELAMKLSFKSYVRGAIMAFPAYIGDPQTNLYYSGDEEAFDAAKPVIDVLGTSIYLGTDIVSATIQEFILVNCMYGFAGGFLNAMALLKSSSMYTTGGAEHFMRDVMGPKLRGSFLHIFGDIARQIDSKDYQTKGDGARLDQQVKALSNMIKMNEEQGISGILLEPMLKLMKTRVAQGGEADEMSALVEVLANPATLRS